MACPHSETVPVETFDPLDCSKGPVITVAARLCVSCHEELPAAWGCRDCEWVEERALCDPFPGLLLAEPCAAHR